jgi:hypothetical protein
MKERMHIEAADAACMLRRGQRKREGDSRGQHESRQRSAWGGPLEPHSVALGIWASVDVYAHGTLSKGNKDALFLCPGSPKTEQMLVVSSVGSVEHAEELSRDERQFLFFYFIPLSGNSRGGTAEAVSYALRHAPPEAVQITVLARSHAQPCLPSPMAAQAVLAVDAVVEPPPSSPPAAVAEASEPAQPPTTVTPIQVGDVGFVRDGLFWRLFNICLPPDHSTHRALGVPSDFSPFSAQDVTITVGPSAFSSLSLRPP